MPPFEEPVALPRGVADADGARGFVRNAHETIDAIRLDTGAPIWRSDIEARPLLVSGARLVAASPSRTRENGLEMFLLDIDGQGHVVGRDELELPDGVSSRDRRDFEYVIRREGESLALSWRARTRYRGGAYPPEEVSCAERRDLRGDALLDPLTGRVSARDVPSESMFEPDLSPSQPYRVQSVWRESAWRAGSQILRLSVLGSGEQRTLALQAVGAEGDGQVKALLEGRRFEAEVTPCGRYVFARTSNLPGD